MKIQNVRLGKQQIFLWLILFFTSCAAAHGSYYYAPSVYFMNQERSKQPWGIALDGYVYYGQTRDSFNQSGSTSQLFSRSGSWDVIRLGLGLNDNQNNNPLKPETRRLWAPAGGTLYDLSTVPAGDGLIDVAGKLEIIDAGVLLRGNLASGFYVQVLLPIKHYTTNDILFIPKGSPTVKGMPVRTYLATNLPAVAREHGLELNMGKTTTTGIGDLECAVGWQGGAIYETALVSAVRGEFKLGILLPTAESEDQSKLITLPFGSNGHMGVTGLAAAEVDMWKFFSLGAHASSTIFFKHDRTRRVNTRSEQNGLLRLTQARVSEDLGSLWRLGAYAKGKLSGTGLSMLLGYSFIQQEATVLKPKSEDYLKDFVAGVSATAGAAAARTSLALVSRDAILNSDPALRSWYQQVLHAFFIFDSRELVDTQIAGRISAGYSYPIAGKNAFKMGVAGGALSLAFDFDF